MIVGAWQQISFPLPYPFFPFMTLAFRAMPVSATIIAYSYVATGITHIYMPAQCWGAALGYSL